MRSGDGDFVLPVDKPEGPTSHDVVAAARRALGTRRVGHTGTLDPFASGLLLLCVGRATRLAQYLTGLDKVYEAVARLGVSTDTLDRDGRVLEERSAEADALDPARIEAALAEMRGDIHQIPPQYSAKKVDGEAMHRRARRGERVELDPVPVTIHEIERLEAKLPDLRFRVRCSSGTYVRAIARDLGRALGVGAHLTALRRTAVGAFDIGAAVPLAALADVEAVEGARIEPVAAVGHLPTLRVGGEEAARIRHGQRLRVEDPPEVPGAGPLRVAVAVDGDLLAIGDVESGVLKPRKVFVS